MSKSYLKYWRYDTLKTKLASDNLYLDFSGSDHYNRVSVGDEVWFVTIPPKTEQLLLFGMMNVGWTGERVEASQILARPLEELWDARYCIMPYPNAPQLSEVIDINEIALNLRFDSSTGKDRLQRIDGTALQSMRLLTYPSAILLRDVWYDTASQAELIFPNIEIYSEGTRKLSQHYRRERNPQLVRDAKQAFKVIHGGLYCEICSFNFSEVYGAIGEDFIEAHHRQALSEIGDDTVDTLITDLAMVCANCHRMLHRRKPWLSVEELKTLLKQN